MYKILKKIFDFYIIRKAKREDAYYYGVAKEKYSLEAVKEKLHLLDYKRNIKPLKILKVYKHANWEDYNLLPALKKFGEVVEYPMENVAPYSFYWQIFKKREFNKKFARDIEDFINQGKINLIFFYASGLFFIPDTFEKISRLRIPTVNLSLDDCLKFKGYPTPTGWSGNKDLCKYTTLTVVNYRESCERYLYEGGRPLYLPEGGNENIYRPLPGAKKDIDVCFVGKNYGKRDSVINFLKVNGINIEVYGLGWSNGPVSLEKLVELYSRSKIAIGFSDPWGTGRFKIPGRDFEVPLIGPMYLTEKNDKISEFYNVGKEIILYGSNEDLLNKIKWYLAHDEERETIAKAGRERALKDHTWKKRFEFIFQFLGVN